MNAEALAVDHALMQTEILRDLRIEALEAQVRSLSAALLAMVSAHHELMRIVQVITAPTGTAH